MTSLWKRAWAIANTPLDARRFRRLMFDLFTPEKFREVVATPWPDLWARIKVEQPSELTAVVPRSIIGEALTRLQADPPDPDGFNTWRESNGRRPLFLAKVDLRNRDLRGYDLSGCILYAADLRGADLRGCRLYGSVLKSARIAGASVEEDTLQGHDLEELADGFESQEFTKYVRSLPPSKRGHLVSITETDRKVKPRKLTCAVKLRSNIQNPLKLRAWLSNEVHARQVSEFVLDPYGSFLLRLNIEGKHFPPDLPVFLILYLDGLPDPIVKYPFWAWNRK